LAIQFSVAIALLYLLSYYVIYPRLDEFTGGALSARFENTRTTGRTEIMEADLKIMADHPVLGVGVGRGLEARKQYYRGFAAHTEFTRLLAEHGSLGCVAILLLIIMGVRHLVTSPTTRERALAAAMLAYSFSFMTGKGMRLVLPAFAFGLAATTLVREKRPRKRRHGSSRSQVVRAGKFPRPVHAPMRPA
jgi:O-antigen ligase